MGAIEQVLSVCGGQINTAFVEVRSVGRKEAAASGVDREVSYLVTQFSLRVPIPPSRGRMTAYPPGLRLVLNGLQRGETAAPGSLTPGIPARRHLGAAQAKGR
jgi:hypothetical protein